MLVVANVKAERDHKRFTAPLEHSSAHIWICPPFVGVCDGAKLIVYAADCEGDTPLLNEQFHCFLEQFGNAGRAGRAANVLHGVDIRAGWIAGGTASGTVLLLRLAKAPTDGSRWADAEVIELVGHSKVVGFLCIDAPGAILTLRRRVDGGSSHQSVPCHHTPSHPMLAPHPILSHPIPAQPSPSRPPAYPILPHAMPCHAIP